MTERAANIEDHTRVSMRMLFFVSDLLQANGVDPRELTSDLPSFAGRDVVPDFITWSEYIELITRLGKIAGGGEGIARSMRATLKTSYSELRALSVFFPGPIPFFSFVNHHLMLTMTPGVHGRVEAVSDTRVRLRAGIREGLEGSLLYFQGTVALVEVFPTHFGLPEARVEVVTMTDRELDLFADFPAPTASVRWGDRLGSAPPVRGEPLAEGEKEVLRFLSEGYSQSQIATALGAPPRAVETELASVMQKMDAANREAFEHHETMRAALRQAVVSLDTASAEEETAGWSFLDHFEAGGRRFVIAMRKDVDVLSERERQILGHAALGLHDKAIAYELGLADATVRVLLHRAAKKLGVRGREEAIARFVKVRGVPSRE